MRRFGALFLIFALALPFHAQVPIPSRCPQITTPDPALPMNQPDRFAWQLFVEVNRKAPAQYQHTLTRKDGTKFNTNSATWETWPDDPWTFPKDPDPANPPKWPDAPAGKQLLAKGKGTPAAGDDAILDTGEGGGEEIHRNRATFDYVIQNNLWYQQGIAAFFAKNDVMNFPVESIEVKANWIQIAEADKSKYHWNYDQQGQLWGLVATHITSKAIPNWFWATFEWVGNAGRCDFIGCHDCFGYTPHHVASNTDKVAQVYPGGTITTSLQALFKQNGYDGAWMQEYSNYRLKGSQTDFTLPTGDALLVGNSVTEGGFVQTASCMTCHARAAVNAQGQNAFPIFGEASGLPLQDQSPENFQNQFTTHHGTPVPSWYTILTGQSSTPLFRQTDFVWAIPFRAQPVKQK